MTAERAAWCLACGRPASRIMGEGVAGTYPIVLCRSVDTLGKPHGCGRIPGTYDEREATTLAWRRHEARKVAAHESGRHLAKPNRRCHLCADALIHQAHRKRGQLLAGCPLCERAHVTMLEVLADG